MTQARTLLLAGLLLGAAPVVFGWSTLALQPMNALIAQWLGFTTMWWADLRATGAGWGKWLPSGVIVT